MTGVLTSLVEASFHPTENGRILYRLGGFRGTETYVIDRPARARVLRRKLFLWYGVGILFRSAMVTIPFVLPAGYLWQLVLFVFALPAFVLSFEIVPKDLSKSSVDITFEQMSEKFVAALSATQIAVRLLAAVSVVVVCAYGERYAALEGEMVYALECLGWASTVLGAGFLGCLIVKVSWPAEAGTPDRPPSPPQ